LGDHPRQVPHHRLQLEIAVDKELHREGVTAVDWSAFLLQLLDGPGEKGIQGGATTIFKRLHPSDVCEGPDRVGKVWAVWRGAQAEPQHVR
jgi:hypothetical protein